MVFLTENWFWRGTQSAIFYYAACTPWMEYKHKRKRRKEAAESYRIRQEIIAQQPGIIPQPAPFETNEGWTEEILRGPHPPKGWKKDPIYYKYFKKQKEAPETTDCWRAETVSSRDGPHKEYAGMSSPPRTPLTPTAPQVPFVVVQDGLVVDLTRATAENQLHPLGGMTLRRTRSISDVTLSVRHYSPELSSTAVDSRPSNSPIELGSTQTTSSGDSDQTGPKRVSTDSVARSERKSQISRPSMDRRLSNAVDTFKDAVRTTLHPDKWNWIRYERDDEILSNLNDKVRSMWGSVKGQSNAVGDENELKLQRVESENRMKKWQRGTHPAINDLHPPVVSQLPYTSEEAKWMLLPPPSADVMMGRSRPDPFDDINRKPLSIIGRPLAPQGLRNSHDQQVESCEEDEVDATEADYSSDGEWYTGNSHLQKPQRAHLRRQKVTVGS